MSSHITLILVKDFCHTCRKGKPKQPGDLSGWGTTLQAAWEAILGTVFCHCLPERSAANHIYGGGVRNALVSSCIDQSWRYIEGPVAQVWPGPLYFFTLLLNEDVPSLQWSQPLSLTKRGNVEDKGHYGPSRFPQKTELKSLPIQWAASPTPQWTSTGGYEGPAAAGEGVHACVMLGYFRRLPSPKYWLPELQPGLPAGWGQSPCLGRPPGARGAWKGDGSGNTAQGVLHLSYHMREATELVPRGFEQAVEFWMEKSEALSLCN